MNSQHIVQIFRRVLNVPLVQEDSDFFDLGGDSLLGTRVLSAIARDFSIELTYDELVEYPTPAGLFDLVGAVAR